MAALYLVQRTLGRKRAEALTRVAFQLGLRYEGDDWLVGSPAPQLEIPLFEGKAMQFRNIVSGERDRLTCSFFDYSYTSGRTSVTQTLASFTQETWLPQFALARQDILHKIGDSILHKTIQFESDADFSKRFRLRGADPEKVRELFSPALLTFIESLDPLIKWNIEGSGPTLVIFRLGNKIGPADYPAFVDNTTRIAQTFFSISGLKKPV